MIIGPRHGIDPVHGPDPRRLNTLLWWARVLVATQADMTVPVFIAEEVDAPIIRREPLLRYCNKLSDS
jgi:hypothetical protein